MVLGRLPLPSDLLEAHDLRPIRGITVGSVVPIESTHKRATQELRELRLPYAKVSHELTADLRILVCGQRHGRFKDGVHGRRIILLLLRLRPGWRGFGGLMVGRCRRCTAHLEERAHRRA